MTCTIADIVVPGVLSNNLKMVRHGTWYTFDRSTQIKSVSNSANMLTVNDKIKFVACNGRTDATVTALDICFTSYVWCRKNCTWNEIFSYTSTYSVPDDNCNEEDLKNSIDMFMKDRFDSLSKLTVDVLY